MTISEQIKNEQDAALATIRRIAEQVGMSDPEIGDDDDTE